MTALTSGPAWAGTPITKATYDVLEDVLRERNAQDVRWGQQDYPDGTGQPQDRVLEFIAKAETEQAAADGTLTYRHIFNEEVREAYAETDTTKLRAELIQTAAVAVAWVEAIDRRTACACGSGGTTSLNPAEVVVHPGDGSPCYIAPRPIQ